jgi:DNA primase
LREDWEHLKQRISLLDYLQQRNWTARRVSAREEFVGLCPLHADTRPSFYVNARKNLFYCHGCGRGGDLIRFVELAERLSFQQTVAYLQHGFALAHDSELLDNTARFYQTQLHRHPEAAEYLRQRGICDSRLVEDMELGYAPGGNLRRQLTGLVYSFDLLLRTGLIGNQGRDAFCRRLIFPLRQQGRVINLYGRSIGGAFPHRLNAPLAVYGEMASLGRLSNSACGDPWVKCSLSGIAPTHCSSLQILPCRAAFTYDLSGAVEAPNFPVGWRHIW